jgi:SulP family sulfate permease
MVNIEKQKPVMPNKKYLFNRMELAGSLGDLGTLLPLAIGMIVINGLNPTGLLFVIGAYYILSGIYFGVTVPVQPMKVIGAYSIAMALTPGVITASGLLMGIFMLLIGITGAIHVIGKYTPKSVVRGVQLGVGTLLMVQGIKFMLGISKYQEMRNAAEPYLNVQAIGPIPIGIILGIVGAVITFMLIENKKIPAALVVIIGGMLVGIFLGNREGFGNLRIGLHFPHILPFGVPTLKDFSFALFILVLPQIPMTIGNAVIAMADLTHEYFDEKAKMTSYRALSNSMGLALLGSFLFGGMPVCHGAGGLAAHYRFGARTAGSNIMVGAIFLILALLFGINALSIIYLIPMSVLGVLLIFAGSQLCLMIKDIKERIDLFVVIIMLGITLATNLAVAFITGIVVAYAFKTGKLNV